MSPERLSDVDWILYIGFGGLGDLIMKTPALRLLHKTYPDAKITMLTNTGPGMNVLKRCPHIDRLRDIGPEKSKRDMNPLSMLNRCLTLRNDGYDLAFKSYYGQSFLASLFVWGTGARNRVGFETNGLLYTHTAEMKEEKHKIEHDLDLIKTISNKSADDKEPEFWSIDDTRLKMRNALSKKVSLSDFLVAIYPGSSKLGYNRRWDLSKYATAIDQIQSKPDVQVVLIGGPDEEQAEKTLRQQCSSDFVSFVNQCSIVETGELLSHCDLFIGNDGGLVHLASGVGLPMITIWKNTNPHKVGPYMFSHENVILRESTSDEDTVESDLKIRKTAPAVKTDMVISEFNRLADQNVTKKDENVQ